MKTRKIIVNQFKEYQKVFNELNIEVFEQFIKKLKNVRSNKKKLFLAGNGGSSSIASHVAVDFLKNSRMVAQTFNEYNLITCFSNDYGYEKWLEKAISFYCKKDDCLVLISSSGESKNIINAAKYARKKNISNYLHRYEKK